MAVPSIRFSTFTTLPDTRQSIDHNLFKLVIIIIALLVNPPLSTIHYPLSTNTLPFPSTEMLSQHQTRPATASALQQNRPVPPAHFSCNICAKILSGTCFRTICDCIFCEVSSILSFVASLRNPSPNPFSLTPPPPTQTQTQIQDCTWKHFESNARCPKCNTTLGEQDFLELVVGAVVSDSKKSFAQGLLTAPNNNSGSGSSSSSNGASAAPSFSNACVTAMTQCDTMKSNFHFLLRQMVLSSKQSAQSSAGLQNYVDALKKDLNQTQTKMASSKHSWEAEMEKLKAQLRSTRGELREVQQEAQQEAQQRAANVSVNKNVTPHDHRYQQQQEQQQHPRHPQPQFHQQQHQQQHQHQHQQQQPQLQRFSSGSSSKTNPYKNVASPSTGGNPYASNRLPSQFSSSGSSGSHYAPRPLSTGSIREATTTQAQDDPYSFSRGGGGGGGGGGRGGSGPGPGVARSLGLNLGHRVRTPPSRNGPSPSMSFLPSASSDQRW